jgi:hypothetical protein
MFFNGGAPMLRKADTVRITDAHQVNRDNHVFDKTQHKEDYPHEVALLDLVPRIQSRARDALSVDRVDTLFFQRKLTGRRCSCFIVESAPDGLCQICYGTGIVGGYTKFGTVDLTIDVTHPSLRSVNVRPLYELQARPVLLGLDDTALSGYIEVDVEIRQSLGLVDIFKLEVRTTSLTQNNSIEAQVKTNDETDFVPATYANLNSRVGAQKLTFRFEFDRRTLSDSNPIFSHFFLRAKLIEDLTISVDIPRDRESITLAEFGIYDSWQTITAYFDSSIPRVGVEDFVFRCRDQELWKVVDSSPNRPLNILTSHDTTLRLIQTFEPYVKVPVGSV